MQRKDTYPLSVRLGSDKTEQVIMTIVFAILLRPAWISTLSGISGLWLLAQAGVFAVLLMILSVNRPTRTGVLVLGISALMLGSTVLNGASLMTTVQYVMPYAGMVLACDMWMKGGRGKQMLIALERLLTAYVLINFATIILFPGGLYTAVTSDGVSRVKCWFLGYKNPQIRTLMPALVILATVKHSGRQGVISMKFLLMALVVVATVIMVESSTSLLTVVGFLMLLVLLSSRKTWIARWLSAEAAVAALLLGTLFVVWVRQFGMLETIMAVLMPNKDISSVGYRTGIWDAAVRLISDNWLIGCGTAAFKSMGGWGVSHPHNYVLYQWITGGIVNVVLALVMFYGALKQLHAERWRFISRVYLAAILMFFVMGIVESLTEFPLLYAMMAIACNLNCLNEEIIDRPEKGSMQAGSRRIIW